LDKFVIIYLDDVLIYSQTKAEHLQHLKLVLKVLWQHKLYAKMAKCNIMKESVEYLGHYLSSQGVSIDPQKIEAINKWTPPEIVSHIRSFLGLAFYYRKFVKNFSAIAAPLTDLLHKDCEFIWADAQQEAFDELKRQLTTAPVLLIPSVPNEPNRTELLVSSGSVQWKTEFGSVQSENHESGFRFSSVQSIEPNRTLN